MGKWAKGQKSAWLSQISVPTFVLKSGQKVGKSGHEISFAYFCPLFKVGMRKSGLVDGSAKNQKNAILKITNCKTIINTSAGSYPAL